MKALFGLFRWLFYSALLLLLFSLGSLAIYMILSPQFGKKPDSSAQEFFSASPQWDGKSFVNPIPTTTGDFFKVLPDAPNMLYKMLFDKSGNPEGFLPVQNDSFGKNELTEDMHIQWFGHSTFLIQVQGLNVLIDPMFGQVPSPFAFGTKRFPYKENFSIDTLPDIDVVLISHDHYEHLDYGSIQALKDKAQLFLVPLGVGSHLRFWGIEAEKVQELDWWQEREVGALKLTATPARHFSGRSITDRDATLWSGWSIKSPTEHLFFSGDGGYGPHFKEIRTRLGAIDMALLECGQYNEAWRDIHMMPEETVQAAIDLEASVAMPIHWGAFRLAPHAWDEPVERFVREAQRLEVPFIVPIIGQSFQLSALPETLFWWQ